MRSQWIAGEQLAHVLAALTPPNRLACEVSLATGLRINDVLSLRTDALRRSADGRLTVHEQKTGKARRIYLSRELIERLLAQSGELYVFEGRGNSRAHRTRQAVYKDLRRAAKAFRLTEHVSPHSLRKIYAVDYFHRTGSLDRVRRLLNHSSEAVTILYAMADHITPVRRRRRGT